MVNKDDYKQFSDKMDKTISLLKEQMNTVRAGRANPAILDKLTGEYPEDAEFDEKAADLQRREAAHKKRLLQSSLQDQDILELMLVKHFEKAEFPR